MHAENQRNVRTREQAGLNWDTTLHHSIHSSIRTSPKILLDFPLKIAYICYTMNARRMSRITERVKKIKEELKEMGPMRPGTLSRQYKSPQKKAGAYWQLSYTRKMKSRTEYVRPDSVLEIRRQIAAYKRFKILIDRWVDLAIEYSKLKMGLPKEKDAK